MSCFARFAAWTAACHPTRSCLFPPNFRVLSICVHQSFQAKYRYRHHFLLKYRIEAAIHMDEDSHAGCWPSLDASLPLAPSFMSEKYAYVTLLTRDAYLMGVQALSRSLRRVHSQYPLVVLYTKTLSSMALEVLHQEGCLLKLVEQYIPKGHHDVSKYKIPAYWECWNKLHLWTLTAFNRLCYLDADMIVLRNIDHVFTLEIQANNDDFAASPDCTYGRLSQEEKDACPLLGRSSYFNAGFFTTCPSLERQRELEFLLTHDSTNIGGYAEQDLLNVFYDGRQGRPKWHQMPWTYNAQKSIRSHHPDLWHLEDIYILHFTDKKPWDNCDHNENRQHRDICDLWWYIFKSMAHHHSALQT